MPTPTKMFKMKNKKLITCSACNKQGHRKNNKIFEKYSTYIKITTTFTLASTISPAVTTCTLTSTSIATTTNTLTSTTPLNKSSDSDQSTASTSTSSYRLNLSAGQNTRYFTIQ